MSLGSGISYDQWKQIRALAEQGKSLLEISMAINRQPSQVVQYVQPQFRPNQSEVDVIELVFSEWRRELLKIRAKYRSDLDTFKDEESKILPRILKRIETERKVIEMRSEKNASLSEICSGLNLPAWKVRRILSIAGFCINDEEMEKPPGKRMGRKKKKKGAQTEKAMTGEARIQIQRERKRRRNQTILEMHAENIPLKEIGKEVHLTPQSVSNIIAEAKGTKNPKRSRSSGRSIHINKEDLAEVDIQAYFNCKDCLDVSQLS